MINALCVHVRRVKEAYHEVKAHWLRASVLTRIVNLHEEGSEQTDFRSWPGTVNHELWSASGSRSVTGRRVVLVDVLSKDEETTSRDRMKIDIQGDPKVNLIPASTRWRHWLVFLTHNCDLLLFSAGPWQSASSLWTMFLAEEWTKRPFSSWSLDLLYLEYVQLTLHT